MHVTMMMAKCPSYEQVNFHIHTMSPKNVWLLVQGNARQTGPENAMHAWPSSTPPLVRFHATSKILQHV